MVIANSAPGSVGGSQPGTPASQRSASEVITNKVAMETGSSQEDNNEANVNKVSCSAREWSEPEKRGEGCVIHLLAMLCNIGNLHVVDRKIFTLARKNHSFVAFLLFCQPNRTVFNHKL